VSEDSHQDAAQSAADRASPQADGAAPPVEPETSLPSPPKSTQPDIGEVEALARIAGLKASLEKTTLETRALSRQLSWEGTLLEWVKAASVFAALIGIATTLYLGQRQANQALSVSAEQHTQAEENRAADRFDKALGRLADHDAGVRMTGVAGLRLFLADSNAEHQKEALHYLVTAIAEEKDVEVQQAILYALADAGHARPDALNDALRTAIELDRSQTRTLFTTITSRRRDEVKALVSRFLSRNLETAPGLREIITSQELSFLQKLEALNIMAPLPFKIPPPEFESPQEEALTLNGLASAISALLSLGARNESKDWTQIYCEACDFTRSADLSGAHFDGSFLSAADFSHVGLRNATFRDADLVETSFFASDLTDADLSWTRGYSNAMASALVYREFGDQFPYLECATLNGANLTNLPIMAFSREFSARQGADEKPDSNSLASPNMRFVKFDKKTRLDRLAIRYDVAVEYPYYQALGADARKQLETHLFVAFTPWPEPIGDFDDFSVFFVPAVASKPESGDAPFDKVRANLTIEMGKPSAISDWAKAHLAGALNQPIWKSLPLTSSILEMAGTQTARLPKIADVDEKQYCSQRPAPIRGLQSSY
jgi:hypothetical protein